MQRPIPMHGPLGPELKAVVDCVTRQTKMGHPDDDVSTQGPIFAENTRAFVSTLSRPATVLNPRFVL